MRKSSWIPLYIAAFFGHLQAETVSSLDYVQEPDSATWAFLQDQGFAGIFRLDYFRSSHQLDDATDFIGATVQAKLTPEFNNNIDGKLDVRIINPDFDEKGDSDSTLLEAYLTAHFEHAQLRIGKQIVVWGRADGVNPTDNLTPHDYTIMLPLEEDQRFGSTAIRLDTYLDEEYTLMFFATPYFLPSKFILPDSGVTLIETRPQQRWSNSEFGVKLSKEGGSIDGSLSYYHGFNLLPELHPLAVLPGPVFELRYTEIDVFGADVARNFGRYGFRAEAAYILTEDRNGHDPVIMNPNLYMVVGMDRTFLDNLNVNIQLTGRWVQHYTRPDAVTDPLQREAAVQNAITFGQQESVNYGMTSRISNKWFHDTLSAELLMFVNFQHNNSYVRPLISYAFTDRVKLIVGGEYYSGADDSYFGRLRDNSGVFSELRYSF